MLNRDFENKVQQKMEELKLAPAEDVWQKVEGALPKKDNRRRWLILLIFLCFITAASLLVWKQSATSENNSIVKNDIVTPGTTISNEKPVEIARITTKAIATDSFNTGTKLNSIVKNERSSIKRPVRIRTSIKQALQSEQVEVKDDDQRIAAGRKTRSKRTGLSRTTITKALPVNDDQNADNTIVTEDTTIDSTSVTGKQTIASTENPDDKGKEKDILPVKKTDTTKDIIAGKTQEKQQKRKWSYGVMIGGGVSNVKKGLFKNEPVYAADVTAGVPGGSTGSPLIVKPSSPKTAAALAIGLYLERNISVKWKFNTGLQYAYQSNKLDVGNRIDSLGSAYSNGTSGNYTNKFHLLQMPLLLQYKLSTRSPVYAEAGGVVSYLVHSNALLYNRGPVYFTDKTAFNKLLFSLNAGAGIDIARNKRFPFSIGYRFTYSLGSVTKPESGKQHLRSSLLYINSIKKMTIMQRSLKILCQPLK